MDNFAEQLVKKYSSTDEIIKKTLLIIAGVIVSILFVFLGLTFSAFILVLIPVAIYGVYWLVSYLHIEYEYTITNGELDIDKIVAKKKRTALLNADVKTFTNIERVSADTDLNDNGLTRFHCSDGTLNHLYFADFEHEEYGKCRLYFSPSLRILENIVIYLKPEQKAKLTRLIEEEKSALDDNEEE
jgi:hypothetical protein